LVIDLYKHPKLTAIITMGAMNPMIGFGLFSMNRIAMAYDMPPATARAARPMIAKMTLPQTGVGGEYRVEQLRQT